MAGLPPTGLSHVHMRALAKQGASAFRDDDDAVGANHRPHVP